MNSTHRLLPFMGALTGALLLAACAGAEPALTRAPSPTAAPVVTRAATPTEAPKPTATATTAPAVTVTAPPKPAASATVYKIVAAESKASYAVNEVFFNRGNVLATAVGVTTIISGEISLDPADPSKSRVGEIIVDLSALKSDSGQRDNFIRRNSLESLRFPLARFKPTQLTGLPNVYKEGDALKFKIAGDMTVRDTTVPVTFDVTASLSAGKLAGTATATIKMSDFKFQAPDIAGTLKADDEVKVKLEFVAAP